ncbi:hypothetical protein F5880DRAFT_223397, partial [Lentinula raphanica]
MSVTDNMDVPPEDIPINQANPAAPTTDPNAPVTIGMLANKFFSFHNLISGLINRIDNLSAAANQPPVNVQPPIPSTTAVTNRGTPKFKEPSIFTGKATQVVGFLQEIRDTLHLLRGTYTTDKDKCLYMATYFGEGTPKE